MKIRQSFISNSSSSSFIIAIPKDTFTKEKFDLFTEQEGHDCVSNFVATYFEKYDDDIDKYFWLDEQTYFELLKLYLKDIDYIPIDNSLCGILDIEYYPTEVTQRFYKHLQETLLKDYIHYYDSE